MSAGSGIFTTQQPKIPHTVTREMADLRNDIKDEFSTIAGIVVEEWTNPPLGTANSIKTVFASQATAVTYSGAALNGTIGGLEMDPTRQIVFTVGGATPSDVPATAVVRGRDAQFHNISETVTLPQIAGSVTTTKFFKNVLSIELPAGQGAGGTISVGTADVFGLKRPIKPRAGLTDVIKAIEGGVVVPVGYTVTDPATSPPYGAYESVAPPDGTTDFAVYYEADFTA